MFKRVFNVLPHRTSIFPQALTIPTSPLFQMQPSLCYQPLNFFSSGSSRNNRNNKNNTDNQLLPIPGFSSKLTKHDVEIKSKGTTINVKVQGKTISYDLGKVVKGATLGDTNRYVLMCTCNVCGNKIVKTFTKKAYHNGVVVILCEKCDNNHLIADNLGWFRDKPVNIESLAKEKGDSVTKIYPDNNMKKIINDLVFVGDKHCATIESDRMGLASSSFLQMIENIEPGSKEMDVKTGRFGGKRGIN